MNNKIHVTVDDILSDEHVVYPPQIDPQALKFYNIIRSANPWLPDANHIPASSTLELTWGRNQMTTLALTVMVELPDAAVDEIGEIGAPE